jgi:Protein of unknown function (DUF2891)
MIEECCQSKPMPEPLTAETAERLANLALACIHREYPNKVAHALDSDADVKPPRELTPAFYGCYDWHSSVHGHWLLARVARAFPDTSFTARAKLALAKSLTASNLIREAEYVSAPSRASFERPYGLAWLLQLAAELRNWHAPEPQTWSRAIEPLEATIVHRLEDWLRKLAHPVRSGEHSQSAFSFGLMLDYARAAGNSGFTELLESKIRAFYLNDRNGPLSYEPSGEDFLSPCLAEADVVRRFLHQDAFSDWLGGFLPGIPRDGSTDWLQPAVVTDPTDGKLAHLHGLNLSRAWMLFGMAAAFPEGDPRIPSLRNTAEEHASCGLASVTGEHYEGAHWLGTYAIYLLTSCGRELHPLIASIDRVSW